MKRVFVCITTAWLGAGFITVLLSAPPGPGGIGGSGGQNPPAVNEWARYDAACPVSGSTVIVECGDLGDYHLGDVVDPAGCTPVASGLADLFVYPRAFPAGSPPFEVPPLVYTYSGWAAAVETAGGQAAGPRNLADNGGSPAGHSVDPLSHDWIAVVDFDDDHGWSTTFAAGETSGDAAGPQLVPLDSDAMQPLGPAVTDFHVLGGLCSIVAGIDSESVPAPLVANMSFGRLAQPGEVDWAENCNETSFACQLVQVVDDLRAAGVTMVAASGNHHDLLFPAVLPDVISVGRLDLEDDDFGPLWEVPAGVDALVPGGHLCLDDTWAAPSGSSYSSALLAGWFAELKQRHPQIDPHVDPHWSTVWSRELSCWVVDNPSYRADACNAGLQEIFRGLSGVNQQLCWDGAIDFAVSSPLVPWPGSLPDVPSFDYWTVEIQPTPTGDPCVPCEGLVEDEDPDEEMQLNMSSSQPLDPDVFLIAVFLKTQQGPEWIPLSDPELQLIRDGELDELTLYGYDWPDPMEYEPSLWYLLSNEPQPDCQGSGLCFWHSSSILVLNH